jgi:hypothetical protein
MSGPGPVSKADDGGRHLGSVLLVVLVVLIVGLLIGCSVVFPRYLAASDMDHAKVTPIELARARNDVRTTLLQAFGGMVLLLGAYLTWRQTQLSRAASREELQLTREGQLTDRFTRAVDQLGSKDVAVRVGGIYALGRIADESITDRASIADLLTAYVRRPSIQTPLACGYIPTWRTPISGAPTCEEPISLGSAFGEPERMPSPSGRTASIGGRLASSWTSRSRSRADTPSPYWVPTSQVGDSVGRCLMLIRRRRRLGFPVGASTFRSRS